MKSPCEIITTPHPNYYPRVRHAPASRQPCRWEDFGEQPEGVLAAGGKQSQPPPALPAGGRHAERMPLSLPSVGSCTNCSSTGGEEEGEPYFCPQCPACSRASAAQALVQAQVVVVNTQLRPSNLPSWSFSEAAPGLPRPSSAGWSPNRRSGFVGFH